MAPFFAFPAVAWLLPAIALPVVFHLFYRLRRQVQPFPSLLFFKRIDPRLSAKRKIHEWLILLLRCLFIALLLLALMRPLFNVGPTGNVARLVLIDNSASMAAPAKDGISKLTLATRATDKLVAAAKAGDSTAVQLMIPDASAAVPSTYDSDPVALRDTLEKLTPTEGAAAVVKALRRALVTLDGARQPTRELHVFTDLHRLDWNDGTLEAQAVRQQVRIIVHHIESPAPAGGWIALDATQGPVRGLPSGRVSVARVTLRNCGTAAGAVRLNTTDDSGRSTSRDVPVATGAPVVVPLTFTFTGTGFHWARVWIEGDAAPATDRAHLGFWCTDTQKVLFVGNTSGFAALPFAAAPGGTEGLSGIEAVETTAAGLPTALAGMPLAVALTWDNWPQDETTGQALENYVRRGGTLWMVPSANGTPGSTSAAALPTWLGASAGSVHDTPQGEDLFVLQASDPFWRDLRDTDGKPKLGKLRLFRCLPLQTGAAWQPLLASADGGAVLARRTMGLGRMFASGVAFAPKWSSLPFKPGFVVMIQSSLLGERPMTAPVRSLPAGEELRFTSAAQPAQVRSLAGSALTWEGAPKDFPGLPRAGVFEVVQNNDTTWVAVQAVAEKAEQRFLPTGSVPLLKNVQHQVVALASAEDVLKTLPGAGDGSSLYGPLLAVALLILLAETWLANERGSTFAQKLFAALTPAALRGKPVTGTVKR